MRACLLDGFIVLSNDTRGEGKGREGEDNMLCCPKHNQVVPRYYIGDID